MRGGAHGRRSRVRATRGAACGDSAHVCSATAQRGGNRTKSATGGAPGAAPGQVSTVKMEGSQWSYATALTGQNIFRSYLYGT